MRRSSGQELERGRAWIFTADRETELAQIVIDLSKKLFEISNRSLAPARVEKLLGPSGAERNRWAKDGRLERAGAVSMRRGENEISLATYAPDAIQALLEQPQVIENWRKADRNAG